MNNKEKGKFSESKIISRFIELGYSVSIPFGENQSYDLIVDDGKTLQKIQVKTGRLRNGCVLANAGKLQKEWSTRKAKVIPYSNKEIDKFAIYCPDTNECYWLTPSDISNIEIRLRVSETKNGQDYIVKWAKDFVL